jgi:hypothetical protein
MAPRLTLTPQHDLLADHTAALRPVSTDSLTEASGRGQLRQQLAPTFQAKEGQPAIHPVQ